MNVFLYNVLFMYIHISFQYETGGPSVEDIGFKRNRQSFVIVIVIVIVINIYVNVCT